MKNEFKKTLSKKITRQVAKDYTENYFKHCRDVNHEPENEILKSLTIDRTAVETIFKQTDCVALRMYLGKTTPGTDVKPDHTLVLVGVDSKNKNIFVKKDKNPAGDNEIYDNCTPCPFDCPTNPF